MNRSKRIWIGISVPVVILLCVLVYQMPAIHNRLSPRIDSLRARIQYAINPPSEAVFVPTEVAQVTSTQTLLPPTETPMATPIPNRPTFTPFPTWTPTITPTPLPETTILDDVVYVDQHSRWNYCGPANLTMALKFWGWPGDRDDVAAVVKPGVDDPSLDFIQQGRWDKNVMPYEMANFVIDHTEFNVLTRFGGDVDVVRRLISQGYPVLVEKGYYEADYTGKIAWLGHYLYTTGYDDARQEFIVQDAYLIPGRNLRVSYEEYIEGWRSFNYLFMVIYPPADEAIVFEALGDYADPTWANQRALALAESEIEIETGIDQFFAWFNKGTSLVELLEYGEAATAYDQAFSIYAGLENDDTQRPYRIMWYQTGPYWAYYYSGRYQDVVNLANTTLNDTISEPTLEESIYWRGMGYQAIGEIGKAIDDYWETVRLNPNFGPGWAALQNLGETN